MAGIDAILFDLDDTLYPERDYVQSGFRAVADHVARTTGGNPADYLAQMLDSLATEGRGRIFDRLIAAFELPPEKLPIADLVDLYRRHAPDIALTGEVQALLRRLKCNYKLAIVTDGLEIMQSNKFTALGLDNIVDAVVYCWSHSAAKPDPKGFAIAMERLQCTADRTIVIGDRPDHDLAAAFALGCRAIRVRSARFAHLPTPSSPLVIGECDRIGIVEAMLP